MSDDPIFERNARAWLDLGPSTAPKRVVDAALRTIASTPQKRDLRGPWRFPHLTLNTRFAVAAAVALAVVAAGALIWRSPQSQIGNPSPSPTSSPSQGPISLQSLQSTWASVGPRPDAYGTGNVQAMTIDEAGLRISSYKVDVTSAALIVNATGKLLLDLTLRQDYLDGDRWECATGDMGTYDATLSPDGQTLTLSSTDDSCALRQGILVGDWTRWDCPPQYDYAYCDHASELAPGRYVAPLFRPFHNGTTGQLAYTLPAGWADLSQPPTWPDFGVASQMSLTRLDAPDTRAINIFANLHPNNPAALPDGPDLACHSATGPFAAAAQAADFLESQPFLSVSGRTAVGIGGLTGVQIDVSVASGIVDPCSWETDGAGQNTYSTNINIFQNAINEPVIYLDSAGGAVAHLILLDGPGAHLVIEVSASDQPSLEAQLGYAMPVIESFEFISDQSPSPTAVISPSAVSATDLQGTWTSVGTRPIPDAPDQVTVFTIGANYLDIHQWDGDVRSSWTLIDAPINRIWVHGPLATVPVAPRWDCFGIGEYDVSLSTDGATLTWTSIDEDCSQREAILAGDWTRDVAAEPSPK